jgi:hypothetical protein
LDYLDAAHFHRLHADVKRRGGDQRQADESEMGEIRGEVQDRDVVSHAPL